MLMIPTATPPLPPRKPPARGRGLVVLLAMVLMAVSPVAADVTVTGYAAAGLHAVEGRTSWLGGGFGRLYPGTDDSESPTTDATAQAHLAVHWQGDGIWSAFLHGTARAEPSRLSGRAGGLIEAYIQAELIRRQSDRWRFRFGHFLLPTSRENIDIGWSSPYTLSFSALNTWIGEEVRVTGASSEYRLASGDLAEWSFGASLFGGNDSNGTLLAWRGWTFGDRLTAFDETLPLPPLRVLRDGGAFEEQQASGTLPFGSDLDGRAGFAAWLGWRHHDLGGIRLTHYDNRGDRELYNGEYAWATSFDLLGFDLHPGGGFSILGEVGRGESGMGDTVGKQVDIDFDVAYLMASWFHRGFRTSVRFDTFENVDRDGTPGDDNSEDGEAWTFALFWEGWQDFRLGVELLDLDVQRPAARRYGSRTDPDGRSFKLEVRWYF